MTEVKHCCSECVWFCSRFSSMGLVWVNTCQEPTHVKKDWITGKSAAKRCDHFNKDGLCKQFVEGETRFSILEPEPEPVKRSWFSRLLGWVRNDRN